jgi:hypothetical protein
MRAKYRSSILLFFSTEQRNKAYFQNYKKKFNKVLVTTIVPHIHLKLRAEFKSITIRILKSLLQKITLIKILLERFAKYTQTDKINFKLK